MWICMLCPHKAKSRKYEDVDLKIFVVATLALCSHTLAISELAKFAAMSLLSVIFLLSTFPALT